MFPASGKFSTFLLKGMYLYVPEYVPVTFTHHDCSHSSLSKVHAPPFTPRPHRLIRAQPTTRIPPKKTRHTARSAAPTHADPQAVWVAGPRISIWSRSSDGTSTDGKAGTPRRTRWLRGQWRPMNSYTRLLDGKEGRREAGSQGHLSVGFKVKGS